MNETIKKHNSETINTEIFLNFIRIILITLI